MSRPRFANRLSAAWALPAAGLCVVGLSVTWLLAEVVPATHARNVLALYDFTALSRPRVDTLANDLLHLLDPLLYTVWGLGLVAVALVRRRARVALAVALVLPAAPLSAEALKPLLASVYTPAGWQPVGAASWPSGHATAAMTLVLCALLVAPGRLRPTIAALGSVFAVAVGFSLLILAWHMPSDVLGGYLLAALFVSLAVAALDAAGRRWPAGVGRPSRLEAGRPAAQVADGRAADRGSAGAAEAPWRGEDLLIPALVALAVAATIAGAALLRAGQVATFAGDHHLLLVVAACIAALVVLISSALTVALRRA
jgi:membrane-associated phospholipid phosphatase